MLAVILTLFFPPAPIKPPVEAPRGQAPQIVTASVDKEGTLLATRLTMSYVTEAREVKVNVGGKEVVKTVFTSRMVPMLTENRWSLDKATIIEAGGRKLDKAALAKRLAKPVAVVVTWDSKPVDPGYLAALKKDAIVIVNLQTLHVPGDDGKKPESPRPPRAGQK
jgi:hypothetical protein